MAQQQSTAIQPRKELTIDSIRGTYSEPAMVNRLLRLATDRCHLISPAPTVGNLLPGCEIALNLVQFDPDDMYKTGGVKGPNGYEDVLGLAKSHLQQLAHNLGISWDPRMSGRVDDRSDPHYCCWRAYGWYRAFDGQVVYLLANKELDLRDGSPTIEGLHAQQRAKNKPNADNQVREMRMHIQQHAETKAQLRAIRSMGIKTGYRRSELEKPFVTARVMFTGKTDDPVQQARITDRVADVFLGAQHMLYGGAQATAAPPPVQAAMGTLAPPPVGHGEPPDHDDFGEGACSATGSVVDAPQDSQPAQRPRQSQRGKPKQQALPETSSSKPVSDMKIPGGREKGKPLEEASTSTIEWWATKFEEDLETGSSRYPDKDRDKLVAFRGELARREGGDLPGNGDVDEGAPVPGEDYPDGEY